MRVISVHSSESLVGSLSLIVFLAFSLVIPGLGAHLSRPLLVSSQGKPGFESLPPSLSGLLFTNQLAQSRHLTNQILLNGSGVAAGDVDGDGWCDLYFCGLDTPNVLFRNLKGMKFEDVTLKAGVAGDEWSYTAMCTDADHGHTGSSRACPEQL